MLGLLAGVFQAWRLILLAAFGAEDGPLTSCMVVYLLAHFLRWGLLCKFGVGLLSFHASVHGFMHETSFFLCGSPFICQVLCTLIYRGRGLCWFLLGTDSAGWPFNITKVRVFLNNPSTGPLSILMYGIRYIRVFFNYVWFSSRGENPRRRPFYQS